MSQLEAVKVIATILASYLPTELATRASAAGLPAQTVAQVATGRHLESEMVGQVGVWCEGATLESQHINGVDYYDTAIIVSATVASAAMVDVDRLRSCWSDSIQAVVKRRFRVASSAVFFAIKRIEVLDQQSSARTPGGIRGALGALGVLRQPPGVDHISVRFTLGQRVTSTVDIA